MVRSRNSSAECSMSWGDTALALNGSDSQIAERPCADKSSSSGRIRREAGRFREPFEDRSRLGNRATSIGQSRLALVACHSR